MAQLDATNGPGLKGSITQGEVRLVNRLTGRNTTNDTNPDTAGDPGQKAAPDTGHLTYAREVGE